MVNVHDRPTVTTFVFTDIEESSRLWDSDAERMQVALARHDSIARSIVEDSGGAIVKMTGDGIYAAFVDPAAAVARPGAVRGPAGRDQRRGGQVARAVPA